MTTYNSPFGGDVVQPIDVSYQAFTISADLVLQWSINGNATGDYAARIMEITPTVAGLSIFMPPANQVSVGQDALIKNVGAYPVYVLGADGLSIVTVDAGKSEYIYVSDNTTVDGEWGSIAFGANASNVSAATLAGFGVLAISNTLNQSHPTATIPTSYTFASNDRAQTKIWGGGTGAATLPLAAALGDNWFTIFKNSGTGTFTLTCSGSETIDGLASKSFNPNESAFIICTGNSYVAVGYGINSSFTFTALVKPITSGAYTLTSSEAQSVIQEYVGTLTGNVTVTYPPIVNFYVIANQTTAAGHTLTITTGISGGATAIIPPGQQATVICDGTNFLNANTTQAGATTVSLVGGTVSTPSLNFSAETNTGLYRPGPGSLGVTILGVNNTVFSATGIVVDGSGTFTGGVAGGIFT